MSFGAPRETFGFFEFFLEHGFVDFHLSAYLYEREKYSDSSEGEEYPNYTKWDDSKARYFSRDAVGRRKLGFSGEEYADKQENW